MQENAKERKFIYKSFTIDNDTGDMFIQFVDNLSLNEMFIEIDGGRVSSMLSDLKSIQSHIEHKQESKQGERDRENAMRGKRTAFFVQELITISAMIDNGNYDQAARIAADTAERSTVLHALQAAFRDGYRQALADVASVATSELQKRLNNRVAE